MGTASDADAWRRIAEDANKRWNEAFNRGDAAGVAACYAADATVLPPAHAGISGVDAIRQFWQGLVQGGFAEHAIEIATVTGGGDLICQVGRWRASGPGTGGQRQAFGGNVVHVLARQADGSWKSRHHIWN
jgi:uncharacterized protein (TIGR02246 family)